MSVLRHIIDTLAKWDDYLIGFLVQEQPFYIMANLSPRNKMTTSPQQLLLLASANV
jgi:hypothetical protein